MLDTTGWSVHAADAFQQANGKGMPLVRTAGCSDSGKELLARRPATCFRLHMLRMHRSPLVLYLNCWEEAHNIAQDIPTAEGSVWHAIIHRMSPMPVILATGSGAWDGTPPFPSCRHGHKPLRGSTQKRVTESSADWDPFHFIDFCEQANAQPGSESERAAIEIQQADRGRSP